MLYLLQISPARKKKGRDYEENSKIDEKIRNE